MDPRRDPRLEQRTSFQPQEPHQQTLQQALLGIPPGVQQLIAQHPELLQQIVSLASPAEVTHLLTLLGLVPGAPEQTFTPGLQPTSYLAPVQQQQLLQHNNIWASSVQSKSPPQSQKSLSVTPSPPNSIQHQTPSLTEQKPDIGHFSHDSVYNDRLLDVNSSQAMPRSNVGTLHTLTPASQKRSRSPPSSQALPPINDRHVPLTTQKKHEPQVPSDGDMEQLLATPEIKEMLGALEFEKPLSVPVSSASCEDIDEVTGFNFCKNQFNGYNNWDLQAQNGIPPFQASDDFTQHTDRWSTPDSEALPRSFLDTYILEALQHTQPSERPLTCYGEVSVSQTNPSVNLTLSGDVDYVLAYGNARKTQIQSILLLAVAKSRILPIGGWTILQLLAYMAIVYRARKETKKINPGVFGFMTNGHVWIFCRIDNDGKVYQSANYTGTEVVLRNLAFVLDASKIASPSTTPFGSDENLAESSVVSSLERLTGYTPTIKSAEEERETQNPQNFSLDVGGATQDEDLEAP
ncbi:hypothetical protein SpCBS45565_g06585 [Spizellomyces sp. 'palustris']|nr:hypothetical protein SpCBS45565_g06585 [Spizellomyces sp. 'palustris']